MQVQKRFSVKKFVYSDINNTILNDFFYFSRWNPSKSEVKREIITLQDETK